MNISEKHPPGLNHLEGNLLFRVLSIYISGIIRNRGKIGIGKDFFDELENIVIQVGVKSSDGMGHHR